MEQDWERIAKEQIDYAIALQRAIEAHCRNEDVPGHIDNECPHHSKMLDAEKAKTDRFKDLLLQIGYPKRGTEEEDRDIFDAAKLIQSNFSLNDLQNV